MIENIGATGIPWRYISDSGEDTDTNTSFNFNENGFPPRYAYLLWFIIEDQSGLGPGTGAQVRVNNDSTNNYNHIEWDGSAFTTNTRDKFFLGFTNTSQAMVGTVVIGGGDYVSEPANPLPTFTATLGTHDAQQQVIRGKLTNPHSTITEITLSAGNNSTGYAELYGLGPIDKRE